MLWPRIRGAIVRETGYIDTRSRRVWQSEVVVCARTSLPFWRAWAVVGAYTCCARLGRAPDHGTRLCFAPATRCGRASANESATWRPRSQAVQYLTRTRTRAIHNSQNSRPRCFGSMLNSRRMSRRYASASAGSEELGCLPQVLGLCGDTQAERGP